MKIPNKFKRVAAVFDEAAKQRPCEGSSGSEYWPEADTDLSHLVNSFIEEGNDNYNNNNNNNSNNMIDIFDKIQVNECLASKDIEYDGKDDDEEEERREMLQDLLMKCVENDEHGTKQKIHNEIEFALGFLGECNHDGFSSRNGVNHGVMSHLRHKGFDAGLCKSRWAETGRFPAGTYEYMDVKVGQTRYMIEIFLADQFEIYQPTAHYTTLLGLIPTILIVDKDQLLRQIMRLMSGAMRKSLKQVGMRVPPWRCNGYLQVKYFSPHTRTTNRSDLNDLGPDLIKKKKTAKNGFESLIPRVSKYSYCRPLDDIRSKVSGVRVGLLAAALQGR